MHPKVSLHVTVTAVWLFFALVSFAAIATWL